MSDASYRNLSDGCNRRSVYFGFTLQPRKCCPIEYSILKLLLLLRHLVRNSLIAFLEALCIYKSEVQSSMCQLRECRSICAKNFTVTLLLRTTRMCSQLLGSVSGVTGPGIPDKKNDGVHHLFTQKNH